MEVRARMQRFCGHLRVREVYELRPSVSAGRSGEMASSEAKCSGEQRAQPVLVIVLCGKRKSGKDHVAERLQQM